MPNASDRKALLALIQQAADDAADGTTPTAAAASSSGEQHSEKATHQRLGGLPPVEQQQGGGMIDHRSIGGLNGGAGAEAVGRGRETPPALRHADSPGPNMDSPPARDSHGESPPVMLESPPPKVPLSREERGEKTGGKVLF